MANNFSHDRILRNLWIAMILGELYSPSLMEVAWLENAQLIFLIFYTFFGNFLFSELHLPSHISRQMYWKIGNLAERPLAKLYPSN